MASIAWFEGDTREAMRQITERNCAFMVYIGKENDDFKEVFKDSIIIQLLNNELVLCYNMDPASQSFENFKEIFDDVCIPSIYLLEKTNLHKYIIKNNDLMDSSTDIQLDVKCRLLNGIQSIIKSFADSVNVDDKQKYIEYLSNINAKLQVYNKPKRCDVKEVIEPKKSSSTARIKIKIPSKEVTVIQEFLTTSSLNDVKTFVLNNYDLPNRPLKCIAHRQFVDEDFSKTLDELELCPSSTVYFHIVPLNPFPNHQSWFGVFFSTIVKPFNFILHFVMTFFRVPPPVEYPRPSTSPNANQINKKTTRKPVSNIHQLKNIKPDDNDENNTYNGNSTQQM